MMNFNQEQIYPDTVTEPGVDSQTYMNDWELYEALFASCGTSLPAEIELLTSPPISTTSDGDWETWLAPDALEGHPCFSQQSTVSSGSQYPIDSFHVVSGYTEGSQAEDVTSPTSTDDSILESLFQPSLASASQSPCESPCESPSPLSSTGQEVHTVYNALLLSVAHDTHLFGAVSNVIEAIGRHYWPDKKMLRELMPPNHRGKYCCAFPDCQWHEKGWKRADRGESHLLKEHFRLIQYSCPHDGCDRVYKWPHDLATHRRKAHPDCGDSPAPKFVCPECEQEFPKRFNLNRHVRNVHKAARRKH
ncbi:hypothetical protein PIIN_02889 [Serendipita indica DSM 11827]|uniref:C2H2-type domain-containing protein n=1 Tax=Serendipita indica (strain DSM 11827) TaxID=1109443 RepID=G4TCH8_SERID|nr:hypothetical protein PIIN_02889 [Serendipita indica DSM 11827]